MEDTLYHENLWDEIIHLNNTFRISESTEASMQEFLDHCKRVLDTLNYSMLSAVLPAIRAAEGLPQRPHSGDSKTAFDFIELFNS